MTSVSFQCWRHTSKQVAIVSRGESHGDAEELSGFQPNCGFLKSWYYAGCGRTGSSVPDHGNKGKREKLLLED